MHLKWPSGHSRLKHGLQAMSIFATFALADRGGVYAVDDDPNRATSGTPSAAATCIRPESLLITTEASDIKSIAEPMSVWPVRSRTADPASPAAAITSAAACISLGEPISHTDL